jgi:O-antigen/teichoic acid export membrane protein
MVNRIAQALPSNDVLKGSAAVLAIRFTASVLGFAMFALASRHMDPAAFGTLAVIFNAMSFLAVVSLCGQETLIVRSWNEYCQTDRHAMARGVLTFGIQIAIVAGLAMGLAVALGWSVWDRSVSTSLLIAACFFMFAQSLMHFSGQFTRVAVGVIAGEFPRELMWRLMVVAVLAVHHIVNIAFDTTEFFLVSGVALSLAVLFQIWRVGRVLPQEVRSAKPQRDIAAWLPRSFKMWMSALMDMTSQYMEVVVIGFFLGPTAAAFYFVATRITNVFAMISGSITIYATSQISTLYYANAKDELQKILRSLALIGAVSVVGAFTVIAVAGKLLLLAFGGAYASAYPALIVLAAGASVSALAGPTAYLLLLTGNEGTYPKIMGAGLALRFLLIAVLGTLFGLMGAVIAWSIAAILTALALTIACHRLVGLDPSLGSASARTSAAFIRLTGTAS